MPDFVLGPNVHANVKALRVALGSIADALSAAKLATLIASEHPGRAVSASLVQRWEGGVEPDYQSAMIMARLAGVTFAEFAAGTDGGVEPLATEPPLVGPELLADLSQLAADVMIAEAQGAADRAASLRVGFYETLRQLWPGRTDEYIRRWGDTLLEHERNRRRPLPLPIATATDTKISGF